VQNMSLDFCLGYKNDGHYNEVFDKNITHNLGKMAEKAGIYKVLWRPDEHNFVNASDAIDILEKGLKKLKDNPDKFKKYDSENGWGLYIHFVPFVEAVLEACKKYPNALIEVSR